MNRNHIYSATKLVLIAIICLVSLFHLSRSIKDPDFFWHLKTGEWIWEHKSLPSEDPFTYTSSTSTQTQSNREHFILTSYWLSQVIYHFSYLLGGLPGIVFLRFIIVGILIFFMLKRKHGDSILYLSLLIIFLVHFLDAYPIERPQVFSFLFFAILLYFLEEVKNDTRLAKGKGIYFLFPLLMLMWANMHGGFILGQAILILYATLEGLKFIHPSLKPLQKNVYRKLVVLCGLGIIFSLFNPNTYNALTIVMTTPSSLIASNTEQRSSLWMFKNYSDYKIILYWFVLVLTIAALAINLKKIDITGIVLLAGIGFFSFITIRYIAFFMIAALPVVGRSLSKGTILKLGRIFIFSLAFFAAIFFTWGDQRNIKNVLSNRWINNVKYPVEASHFILKNNIQGNIFSSYEWGGYLIWRLGPERKVFIDGRAMHEDVFKVSRLVLGAYAKDVDGLPYWKYILNAYNVNCVILPLITPSGDLPLLSIALLKDNDWVPLFLWKNSMIFIKDSPINLHFIRYYSIPKDQFILGAIEEYKTIIRLNPEYLQAYISLADFYIMLHRLQDAKLYYEKALEIAPFNKKARKHLEMLKLMDMKRDN